MEWTERLAQIRTSPKLQNQQQNAVVLSAVEDTLRNQESDFTPTAYFAALLSLLSQYASNFNGEVNLQTATAVVYLLDVVTPHVPAPLLRSKFSPILSSLAPVLTHSGADAPFLRPAIGCLVSLLIVQDGQAWALPQSQISPRRAVAGLLVLALDPRPKVRKRAQDGISKVLQNAPPSPSLDHPAAEMCAETAIQGFGNLVAAPSNSNKPHSSTGRVQHSPEIVHSLQLIKSIASASGGWPARSLDSLCDILLSVTKSHNEFLNIAAFDVFEVVLENMAIDQASSKLPKLLEIVANLQPALDDSQLFPPWAAVISRGFDVAAQTDPETTFEQLPEIFMKIASFLVASSHNIRVSASECLISFLVNCIPREAILDPSIMDEKTFERLANMVNGLFAVKYQAAWPEVFKVVGSTFDALRWQCAPLLTQAVSVLGELRGNESFTGKKEADEILGKAIRAMGPESVLEILPLNLANPKPGQQGRAWLVPIMRDSVANTKLGHFKKELIPLSETLYQRISDHGPKEKSIEIKIYETLIQQIWATLPGYCDRPLDMVEAFDQAFAEMLSTLLYQQPELRTVLCQALQALVESFKMGQDVSSDVEALALSRISETEAKKNLAHLSTFATNLLAVLFNVYNQTSPSQRAPILSCVDAYLSIAKETELLETFTRVCSMLEAAMAEDNKTQLAKSGKATKSDTTSTAMGHSLMDILVAMTSYLPRDSFSTLFSIAAHTISKSKDVQLQKKAYKLIPRLAQSSAGRTALAERNAELQQMLLSSAGNLTIPARRDRLLAISTILESTPQHQLHFIPAIISEVILYTKESNERARLAAFEVLVQMGRKMQMGGVIDNSQVPNMPATAPTVAASLEEYLTMLSAGLADSTPHMVSASITAISRVMFEFMSSLSESTATELVQTISVFFHSPNREVVSSVLGFVKVCIISLPMTLMTPRIPALIPSLLMWSREHNAHFRMKVKHILERIMRRFGVDIVERNCPEEGQKLIKNIRKTRERKKRNKSAANNRDGDQTTAEPRNSTAKFDVGYDEVIYGSDEDEASSDSEVSKKKHNQLGKHSRKQEQTYIIEDDDPLDLLDRKALANISSRRPLKPRPVPQQQGKAKLDQDGKLILREEGVDDDVGMDNTSDVDNIVDEDNHTLEGGINAYVEAIRGRHAAQRGQRGRLKFSNKRERSGRGDMDVDGEDDGERSGSSPGNMRGRRNQRAQKFGMARGGKARAYMIGGGVGKPGIKKASGARVAKRGGGGFRR